MLLVKKLTSEFELSQQEFDLFKELMYKETGVFLKPSKKTLVIARLRNRLKKLNIDSFQKYYELLKNPLQKSELEYFVNSITTNETYFNRNLTQFNYIKNTIIPEYIKKKAGIEKNKRIRIWSSASSTGEEPYTLAILLRECLPNLESWQINIYASDVNSDVLKVAKEGIYPEEKMKKMPAALIRKYFTKGESSLKKTVYTISSKIKSMVNFFQHNLLMPSRLTDLDIIFVSNVLIYFDIESKQKVIDNVSRSLNNKGYLFLGQSESLMSIKHDFRFILPSSFIKEVKK